MAFPLSPWTDELVQKVKLLWPDHSARDISKIIARDHRLAFSKSSIISKMKREGLVKPVANTKPLTPRPRRVSTKTFTPKSVAGQALPFVPRIVETAPRLLTIYQLENGDCRYPSDSADHPAEIRFCGNPVVEGCSYCGVHKRLCHCSGQAGYADLPRAGGGVMADATQPAQALALRIPKGRVIVRQVLVDHGLDAEEFFGPSRFAPMTAARRDAARRLRDSGFSWRQIARIIRRHEDTVRCYLTDQMRIARRDRMRERRAFAFMSADVVETILAFAEAENVTPEVLIAQWASERATYEASAKARAA